MARGMDFPNVTNVFQAGIPADKESYIHRLGRTARAGREGRAFFIVTEAESFFPTYTLKEIKFEPAAADHIATAPEVGKAAASFDNKGKVYQAWLGYYKTYTKQLRWDVETLVDEANMFAFKGLIAGEVPGIPRNTVGKMGLKGVKGLNVVANFEKSARGGGGGRGGKSGGGEGRSAGAGGKGRVDEEHNNPRGGGGGGRRGGGGGKRGGFRGEQRGSAF